MGRVLLNRVACELRPFALPAVYYSATVNYLEIESLKWWNYTAYVIYMALMTLYWYLYPPNDDDDVWKKRRKKVRAWLQSRSPKAALKATTLRSCLVPTSRSR